MPTACKFAQGAVCDPATDLCCTDTCGFASNSTLCRASKDEACDLAEYCTGSSRSCPKDETKEDGQCLAFLRLIVTVSSTEKLVNSTGLSCGSNGLACASGQCTSKDCEASLDMNKHFILLNLYTLLRSAMPNGRFGFKSHKRVLSEGRYKLRSLLSIA